MPTVSAAAGCEPQELLLVQHLPEGVFADPYQLADLSRTNKAGEDQDLISST